MKNFLWFALLCVSPLAFSAEISIIKMDQAVVRDPKVELKVGDNVEIRDSKGAAIGTAVVSKPGKEAQTFVLKRKTGKWAVGSQVFSSESPSGVVENEKEAAPQAESAHGPLKRATMFSLGVAKPTETFLSGTPMAAAFDYFFPLTPEFNLRGGLWGFFRSEESSGTKVTYTILTVDLGVDYFFLNGNFKMGVGGRLGYTIPIVTITINGTPFPFSGKAALTPAASLSAYYNFSGFYVGAEVRAAFYPKSSLGVPTSIFYLLSFGKEM